MKEALLAAVLLFPVALPSAAADSAAEEEPEVYGGFLVGLQMRGLSLPEALEQFQEYEELEFVLEPGLEELSVEFHFHHVPWRRALDLLLATHGLEGEEEEGVLRVRRSESPAQPLDILLEGMALIEMEIYLAEAESPLYSACPGLAFPEDGFGRGDLALLEGYGSDAEALKDQFSLWDLTRIAQPRLLCRTGKETSQALFEPDEDGAWGIRSTVTYAACADAGKLYLKLALGDLEGEGRWFRGGIRSGERLFLGSRSGDPPFYVFLFATAWAGQEGEIPSYEESRQREVGGLNPPKLITGQHAKYPRKMNVRDIDGEVLLRILVGEDGTVQQVEALEWDSEEFRRKAVRAVRKWKYEPGTKDGKPVAMWTRLVYYFYKY